MSGNDEIELNINPQQRFTQLYVEGHTLWDSGISPPELLAAIQGPAALPPGSALDVGCGTGTNSLMLAQLGWRVLGVDFATPAIAQAEAKAMQMRDQIAKQGGSIIFIQADITQLAPPSFAERRQLILDIGCLNSVPFELRTAYAQVMSQQAAPGSLFLLYAHLPPTDDPEGSHRRGPLGCTPDELDALFSANFVLEKRVMGMAPQGDASMWNWWQRRA